MDVDVLVAIHVFTRPHACLAFEEDLDPTSTMTIRAFLRILAYWTDNTIGFPVAFEIHRRIGSL